MSTNSFIEISLSLLKKCKYRGDMVERWTGRQRRDLCGFGDLLAWRVLRSEDLKRRLDVCDYNLYGVLCVQCCGVTGVSSHIAKVTEGRPRHDLQEFLSCGGNRFEIWGWKGTQLKRTVRVEYNQDQERFDEYGQSEIELFGWDPETGEVSRARAC